MSFRKYGGTTFAAKNNVTHSYYNNTSNLGISGSVGQQNSYITFNSDISGNNIYSAGTVTATSFTMTSDYRIKENVRELDNLFNVNNLRPIIYYNTLLAKDDIGFIAHEVQEQYPFMVSGKKDGDPLQSINYNSLIGILVKEIKDLKQEMTHLKEEITILKSK